MNSTSPSISVWFACRICGRFYQTIDNFIEHKKENHFEEFQKTDCIIFEEKNISISSTIGSSGESEVEDLFNLQSPVPSPIDIDPLKVEVEETQQFLVISPTISIHPDDTSSTLVVPNEEEPLTQEQVDSQIQLYSNNTSQQVCVSPNNFPFPQHECKLCGNKFNSESELCIHVERLHEDNGRNRYCIPCNKLLCNPDKLRHHNKTFHLSLEEKEKASRFKCEICPKKFLRKQDLAGHMKTHMNTHMKTSKSNEHRVRSFKCVFCPGSFYTKSSLTHHTNTVHSENKRFKCPHPNCDKAFKVNSNLKLHLTFHSNTKQFHCSHPGCDKFFKYRTNMNAHFKTHSGEKFKCTEGNCTKIFTRVSDAVRHKKKVHRETDKA